MIKKLLDFFCKVVYYINILNKLLEVNNMANVAKIAKTVTRSRVNTQVIGNYTVDYVKTSDSKMVANISSVFNSSKVLGKVSVPAYNYSSNNEDVILSMKGKIDKKIESIDKKLDDAKENYALTRKDILWNEKWKIISDYTGIDNVDEAYKKITST